MTSSLAESLGAGHTAAGWARDFLTAIGAPATPRNVNAVIVWETHESGGGGGRFNPLNTTQSGYPGETAANYNNGFPVKNYATYADGIAANAQAFNSGARRGLYGYDRILAAFNNPGTDPGSIFAAINASSWGTHNLPTGGAAAPNVIGVGSANTTATLTSSTGAGGSDASSDCLWKLGSVNLPGPFNFNGACLLDRSQGRALLGAASLATGALLIVAGLGFIAFRKVPKVPVPL